MYIRTLVFALLGNHKLKKVYKNKMFYGDLSNWSLPLSKAYFSGARASRILSPWTTGSVVQALASEQAHKHPPSILADPCSC